MSISICTLNVFPFINLEVKALQSNAELIEARKMKVILLILFRFLKLSLNGQFRI